MKKPTFDLNAVTEWLVRHGEKLVVAVVGLGACLLAWGGVQAMRALSVTDSLAPKAVQDAAALADGHIARAREVPAELRPPREPLANAIDPWRTTTVPWLPGDGPGLQVSTAEPVTLLNRPLFAELAKRTRPEVLPVEDLRAVAGIAILPVAARPAGPGVPPRPPAARPPAKPPKPEPGGGRRPPRGGDPLDARTDPAMAPLEQPGVEDAGPTARIVPYVIVTGLIPVAKQKEDYRTKLASSGFPDPVRDTPSWSDFEIDRGLVGDDGKVAWKTIDLRAVAKRIGVEAAAGDATLADVRLADSEENPSGQTPVDFCGPVPTRIDGTWELADLHPWVVEWLARKREEQERREAAQPGGGIDPRPGREGPGFGAVEERPGAMPEAVEQPEAPPFRLFRFVDMDVQPGCAYRYRVRLKVWNPNWDEDPERMRPQLADPSLATEKKLASPDAETAVAARVPDTTRILVGSLRPDEIKDMRIKPGTLEVLVLAPSENTGSFALRAFVADPGAVIDIDDKFNVRNQSDRCRGEKLATGSLLLDAMGRQEDRGRVDEKGRPIPPAEPFAVVCLKQDGTFEFASVDGSARDIAAYGRTLPPRLTKSGGAASGAGEDARGEPALDMLAPPGGVR